MIEHITGVSNQVISVLKQYFLVNAALNTGKVGVVLKTLPLCSRINCGTPGGRNLLNVFIL